MKSDTILHKDLGHDGQGVDGERGNGLSECGLEALLGAYKQYEFISQISGTKKQPFILPMSLSLARPLHQFLFFGDIKKVFFPQEFTQ